MVLVTVNSIDRVDSTDIINIVSVVKDVIPVTMCNIDIKMITVTVNNTSDAIILACHTCQLQCLYVYIFVTAVNKSNCATNACS